MRMSMLSRRLAPLFAASLATAPVGAAGPLPPDSILLLVASWCVPCHGEVARLDELQAAAGHVVVRVVPYDGRPATKRMLARVDPARVTASSAIVAALASRTPALPYSVMTDADGRICADHARALDVEAVRTMRRRCAG